MRRFQQFLLLLVLGFHCSQVALAQSQGSYWDLFRKGARGPLLKQAASFGRWPLGLYGLYLIFPNLTSFTENWHDLQPLTDDERRVLQGYTRREYGPLNEYLRKGKGSCESTRDPQMERNIEDLHNALAKIRAYEGQVYRGLKGNTEQMEEKILRLSKMKEGDEYVDEGFVSTSKYRYLAEYHQTWGGPLLAIKSLTGRRIHNHSFLAYEREILFDRKTRFVLVKKDLEKNIYYFEERPGTHPPPKD